MVHSHAKVLVQSPGAKSWCTSKVLVHSHAKVLVPKKHLNSAVNQTHLINEPRLWDVGHLDCALFFVMT